MVFECLPGGKLDKIDVQVESAQKGQNPLA
jgi:hypothetical protein